jgi:uncharacterized protein (TIGR02058 family)
MKRFIVEFGMGTDFHGQDVNKAAVKAVRDAVSRSCLSGLVDVLDIKDLDTDVQINVTVSVSDPAAVNPEDIAKCLPVGKVSVNAVQGGLHVPGLYMERFGDKDDSIVAAIASVEVLVP